MLARTLGERLRASKKSVLLLGARQVGKSTLTRALSPDLVVNLADEAIYLGYAKDPSRLRREIAALAKSSLVVLDEIQRVPALLNTVQAVMDEGTRHRFILTGSSARKLKRGGANLLPGRIVLEHLDPLSVWEMGDAFDLDRVLQIGSLPGIYLDPISGADVLDTYATVYLREEVRAESIIRDVGTYARFLDVAALSSNDWINYSKLASDTEIAKETVRRFFQILEDTLLAFRLPPFATGHPTRRVSQRDRILLFDLGVRNALLGLHRHPVAPTEKGRLFEHWLVLQCLYFIRSHRLPWRAFGYRTDAGAEVDLVVDTGKTLLAVECKLGRSVTGAQLRGLASFATAVSRPVRKVIVFQGERAQRFAGGTVALPLREFLFDFLPDLA
ncbi:MAG: ATP-binding protein [Deltaproteobacteria bacterium]|nr:ATP-binding protein [Deltaproteobacteria bacterium]